MYVYVCVCVDIIINELEFQRELLWLSIRWEVVRGNDLAKQSSQDYFFVHSSF